MSNDLFLFGNSQWTLGVASTGLWLGSADAMGECRKRDFVYLRSASEGQFLVRLSSLNSKEHPALVNFRRHLFFVEW